MGSASIWSVTMRANAPHKLVGSYMVCVDSQFPEEQVKVFALLRAYVGVTHTPGLAHKDRKCRASGMA
jgi:hypothetical protein